MALLYVIKTLFNWAVSEGHLESSPINGLNLKRPKEHPVEPWRPENIERMFDVVKHDWTMARAHRQKMMAARENAPLSLFLESFIRLKELAQLEVEDVDLQNKKLLVRQGKMGKGRWVGFWSRDEKKSLALFRITPGNSNRQGCLDF